MKVVFRGELRAVVYKGDFTRRDGTVGHDYRLTVECDGDSEQFPCDEAVFKDWNSGEIKKGSDCT